LASPRRIEDLVARLIHTGFLESSLAEQDGRVRLLAPTDKMLEADQGWLSAHYLPLDVMFPDPGYPEPMRNDHAFQRAQRLLAIQFLGHGAQIMAGNPAMMLFLTRDAGATILIKLVQIAIRDQENARDGLQTRVSELSHEDIGALFGVSRTHVRKTLQDAAKQGLFTVSGRGHRLFEIMPVMWQAFDRFVAESMSGHDLMYGIAMKQMRMADAASN
jgi:CRP-like cAMP-binding protein